MGQICVVPGQCATDYIEWFYIIFHPFMSLAQPENPRRHLTVVDDETFVEPNIPQLPVAVAAMDEAPADAPTDVEQPRHGLVKHIFN